MQHRTRMIYSWFSTQLKCPLSPHLLRNEEGVSRIRQSLKARFRDEAFLEPLISSYETYRQKLHQYETLRKQINTINSRMKEHHKTKDTGQIDNLLVSLTPIKQQTAKCEKMLQELKLTVELGINKIGNLVEPEAVISKDEKDNRIVQSSRETKPILNISKTSYKELNEIFKISDLKRGQKVSGHRGYFLTGSGVKLALALAQYGLSFLQKEGYSLYQTPALILEDVLQESCQLQTVDNDVYRLKQDNLCLIATSEQTLAGYYREQVLEHSKLPIKMAGYSTCFRREAGAHGKDIHGLFRVHQFEKVEQFIICKASDSQGKQMMEEMIDRSCRFYDSLSIPYRVVDIVSGQLNDAAARKYDIEGWYPSQNTYRQLVSVSNCTNYQSSMLGTQYRQGKENKYVYMLNGTLIAIQRAMTCLLENNFDSEKKVIEIPPALAHYMGENRLNLGD